MAKDQGEPGMAQPVYQVIQVVPVIPARPTSGKAIASLVTGILLMVSSVYALPYFLIASSIRHYNADGSYTILCPCKMT